MQKNVIYSTCLSESTLISKVLCGTFSHSHCNLQFQFCKFIGLSLHDTIGNYGMVFHVKAMLLHLHMISI